MRVLITGASGLIGRALAARLAQDGDLPVPVRRGTGAPGSGTWDPAAGRLDATLLPGAGAVVNLAGESIAGGLWTRARRRRIRDSRAQGTAALAQALAGTRQGPRTLVSVSAVGYYGHRAEEILTETSPPGTGFLSDVAVAWEAAAAPAREAGVRVVHPRIGVVLDPGGGMLRTVLPLFRAGLGGRLGDGRQWMSWIALADVVEILVAAVRNTALAGPLNAVAPGPVRNAEFTAALARALRRPAILHPPAFALRRLMGAMAEDLLLSSQRCRPAALESAGFVFRHPDLAETFAAILPGPRHR